jgi:hypothetical protein
MTTIATQLCEMLAQKRRFCGRHPKCDVAATPIIRSIKEWHERRVETDKRMTIVIGRRPGALQQPMRLRSRNGSPINPRTQYSPDRERIPIHGRWWLARRLGKHAPPDHLGFACALEPAGKLPFAFPQRARGGWSRQARQILEQPRHEKRVTGTGVQYRRAWEEEVGKTLMDSEKTDFIAHAFGFFVHLRLGARESLPRQIGPAQRGLNRCLLDGSKQGQALIPIGKLGQFAKSRPIPLITPNISKQLSIIDLTLVD